MSFGQAIKSLFVNYVNFSGRASRSEFWYATLFIFLASAATGMVDGALRTSLFQGLFGLAVLLPNIAVQVRRLHDINRSGWWLIGLFCPGGFLVGLGVGLGFASRSPGGTAVTFMTLGGVAFLASYVLLLVWLCTRGTQGPNRFGANPLSREAQGYAAA